MMDGARNCPMQLGVHKFDEKGYDMQRNDKRAKVALASLRRGLCTLRMRRRQAARPASAAPWKVRGRGS